MRDPVSVIVIVGVILLCTLPFIFPTGLLWMAYAWGIMGLVAAGYAFAQQRPEHTSSSGGIRQTR